MFLYFFVFLFHYFVIQGMETLIDKKNRKNDNMKDNIPKTVKRAKVPASCKFSYPRISLLTNLPPFSSLYEIMIKILSNKMHNQNSFVHKLLYFGMIPNSLFILIGSNLFKFMSW